MCERQFSFRQLSLRKTVSPSVPRCVRKTLHTCSVSSVSQPCVSDSPTLLIERRKGIKESKGESNVGTNESKSQQGWEEGAGLKGTAGRDRCTRSQNQPKLVSKKES